MSKMLEVRREFGEPFADVVRGFAEMGYSRTATAQALGFNLPYFRTLLTRFDLHRHFKPQREQRPECRGKGTKKPGMMVGGRVRNGGKRKYTDEHLLQLVSISRSSSDF